VRLIRWKLHRISEIWSQDLTKTLIGGGLGSIIIKVFGILSSLIGTMVVARLLGATNFGTYGYIISLVTILTVPAQFGLQDFLVRETAKAQAQNDWGRMKAARQWSTKVALISSVCLMGVAIAIIPVLEEPLQGNTAEYLIAVLLIPTLALSYLRAASLRGLRHVILGQLPERVLRPLLAAFLVFITYAVLSSNPSPMSAILAHLLAAGASFAVGALLLRRVTPHEYFKTSASPAATSIWLRSAIPLALISGANELSRQVDVVILGFFVEANSVGIYKVAVQGATIVAFGLSAGNIFLAPYFARMYARSNIPGLERLAYTSAAVIFAMSLPIYFLFLFFGPVIVSTLFGTEYSNAAYPLIIISTGQLVNAFTASAGIILAMCGFERETSRWLLLSVLINIFLNLALIPSYGMLGAAWAAAIAIVVQNVILWRLANKRLGFEVSALGILRRRNLTLP
jgi:O-antigen/teichoic acid export membrane protein